MKEQSVWWSVWCSPRATIRHIVEQNPKRAFWGLCTIYGFPALLNAMQSISAGESVGIFGVFLLAILLAPLWGFVVFSVASGVVLWTGKWLRGKGSFGAIRACYAWSSVPILGSCVLWLILMGIFGKMLFVEAPIMVSGSALAVLFLILLGKVVLAVWSLVLYVQMLREVQGFSVGRSLANILLSIGVFLVAMLILIFLQGQVMGSIGIVLRALQI